MPGLVRKLLIFAAVDGIVLQPVAQRNQRTDVALKIDYKTHTILPQLQDVSEEQPAPASFESHGIIGLLTLASSSYLISILRREPVAQFWGKPVYVVTDVALIPISSRTEAELAIKKVSASLRRHPETDDVSSSLHADDSDTDTVTSADNTVLDDITSTDSKPLTQETPTKKAGVEKDSGIAENVINRKGVYGRFADKWFSRRGWTKENRKLQGMSAVEEPKETQMEPHALMSEPTSDTPAQPATSGNTTKHTNSKLNESLDDDLLASMSPKLLHTAKLLFGSRTFFFSYDHDLTRRLSQGRPTTDIPLHKQADPQYFWNQHLTSPFIESGHHGLVLPIMQGFVGQTTLDIEPELLQPQDGMSSPNMQTTQEGDDTSLPQERSTLQLPRKLLLTLISRRSVNRAGLRYLRRGIDEDGNVANNVETEQLLSSPSWSRDERIQSFVQIRGSMPVFFSQTPYTFKPPPVLYGSWEANQKAMKKHFAALASQYGPVQAVSLIDRHGSEVGIGEAYEENVKQMNATSNASGKQVAFEWFEFHHVCRGMKFENVSILVDSMDPFLESSGWTCLTSQSSAPSSTQNGIIRTNCMDCLDRTNVVQSAFAQHILNLQLRALTESESTPPLKITASSLSQTNSLWADNGDAISRAYAGTAALKGDYTRTRKRNLRGALTDLTLTLSRYYRNLFDDFFAQAAIDYLLGNVTAAVFAEFQTTMSTADPAMDVRRARQAAIATASHIVVEESEDLRAGWALGMPANPRELASRPFEEALMLLSDKAVYAVHFDWNTEKVRGFERIELDCLTSVQWGAYITETMAPAHMDVKKNVGLVLNFEVPVDGEAVERTMTRAMANVRDVDEAGGDKFTEGDGTQQAPHAETEKRPGVLAFKVLAPRTSVSKGETITQTEQELVRSIVEEIVMASAQNNNTSESAKAAPLAVEQRDIISVEEAKKTTGYLEQIGYSLKKMVWG